jgi:ATP-dependent Lhr-like helicase
VVATSTLELGIDVGDLDRVIQLDAPRAVASFLQRLGRTGRRAGAARNCLFLATRDDSLLAAAGVLGLWGAGFVEPVLPPPHPRHIAAQQFLALALQEGRLGLGTWGEWWGGLPVMDDGAQILEYLVSEGFLETDSGLAFVGPQAERHFGRRHFMELLSAFTADPLMTVLQGRTEIGSVSPLSISSPRVTGEPTVLILAGRTWRVTSVDWSRRRIQVVEHKGAGRTRWSGEAPDLSFDLARSIREVLLGTDPPVELSRRAVGALGRVRAERSDRVDPAGLVLERNPPGQTWWTFAGTRANATLAGALSQRGVVARASSDGLTWDATIGVEDVRSLGESLRRGVEVPVDDAAVDGLKFAAALPMSLARATLAERRSDSVGARSCAEAPIVLRS